MQSCNQGMVTSTSVPSYGMERKRNLDVDIICIDDSSDDDVFIHEPKKSAFKKTLAPKISQKNAAKIKQEVNRQRKERYKELKGTKTKCSAGSLVSLPVCSATSKEQPDCDDGSNSNGLQKELSVRSDSIVRLGLESVTTVCSVSSGDQTVDCRLLTIKKESNELLYVREPTLSTVTENLKNSLKFSAQVSHHSASSKCNVGSELIVDNAVSITKETQELIIVSNCLETSNEVVLIPDSPLTTPKKTQESNRLEKVDNPDSVMDAILSDVHSVEYSNSFENKKITIDNSTTTTLESSTQCISNILSNTSNKQNTINLLSVNSCSKSRPTTSNSISEGGNLKTSSNNPEMHIPISPTKIIKLSQQLLKQPGKFVGPCSSTAEINSRLKNQVQTPKKNTSPRKRISKFSPVRFLKNGSPNKTFLGKRFVGQNGDKKNVSKKLNFQGSDVGKTMPELPSHSSDASMFDKEPLRDEENFYVKHFRTLILEVMQDKHTLGLMNQEELKVINDYFNMPQESKELYIRMYNRKFMWHRVSKIKYNMDVTSVFTALESQGLVTSDIGSEDLDTIIHLLDVSELKKLCKSFELPHNKNKVDLIQALLQYGKCQRTLTFETDSNVLLKKRILQNLGFCIKLCLVPRQLFKRMELLFSLPFREEDSDSPSNIIRLHNVETGKMSYPTYNIIKDVPIFASRDDVISYEEAETMANDVSNAVESKNWDAVKFHTDLIKFRFKVILKSEGHSDFALKLPVFLRKFTTGSALAYGLHNAITALKRSDTEAEAIEILRELLGQHIYLPKYRGYWYDQLALVLYKNPKNGLEVANIIAEAMKDPNVDEIHHHMLSKRASMLLSRKCGQGTTKKKLEAKLRDCPKESLKEAPIIIINAKALTNNSSGFKAVYIQENADTQETTYSSVEELAISHYRSLGYEKGIHCEGSILQSIFGLVFWDIIYGCDVPNVFLSHYQTKPLDLSSGEFYLNRKEAIDGRLHEMKTWTPNEVRTIIEKQWNENDGKCCLVTWTWFHNFKGMLELVDCIGMILLAKLCGRLAKNYRIARSGFPDLVVWSPGKRKCKFVEVKGHKDVLRQNQQLWMDFLITVGANAEVCFVHKIGTKPLNKKSPKKATRVTVVEDDSS